MPCAGVGLMPCPHGKQVQRQKRVRCPDCTLAHRRAEDQRRLDRIRTATPPATTLDGQLQRMRDRNRALEAGDPVPDEDGGEDETAAVDELEDVLEDVDARDDETVIEVAPAPPRMKPGHRQPARPPDRVTGERPWWARTKPGELTRAATARQTEMSAEASRRGIRVDSRINE